MPRLLLVCLGFALLSLAFGCKGAIGPDSWDRVARDQMEIDEELAAALSGIKSMDDFNSRKERLQKILDRRVALAKRKRDLANKDKKDRGDHELTTQAIYREQKPYREKLEASSANASQAQGKLPKEVWAEFNKMKEAADRKAEDEYRK